MVEPIPESMVVDDARKWLPSWLHSSAVLQRHRCVEGELNRLDALIQRAYELLGHDEYKRIFDRTVYDVTGERYRYA